MSQTFHGLTPIEYKVIVQPEEETGVIEFESGFKLYKPDEKKDQDEHAIVEGTIVALSPFAFGYEGWPEGSEPPKVGDAVVYANYSGQWIKGNDGVKYRIMNDKDIMAIRDRTTVQKVA